MLVHENCTICKRLGQPCKSALEIIEYYRKQGIRAFSAVTPWLEFKEYGKKQNKTK